MFSKENQMKIEFNIVKLLIFSNWHPAHSYLRKESPAELMLPTFVWGKTASGTSWSKKENRHSISFPLLLLGVPEAVLSYTKTWNRSHVQSIFCVAPCCPIGSLIPYKSAENQFLASLGKRAAMVIG